MYFKKLTTTIYLILWQQNKYLVVFEIRYSLILIKFNPSEMQWNVKACNINE